MANYKSDILKNTIWGSGVTFTSATVGFGLVDTGTDAYVSTDDTVDDAETGLVARTANLASKTVGTVAVGTIDAADATASSVSGATVEQIIFCENTGTSSNDHVWAAWDTGVTGLPATPNGGDITVQINASGIISTS